MFPIIQHLRPRPVPFTQTLVRQPGGAENISPSCSLSFVAPSAAVFIAYGIIACRTSAPFLCIKYRRIYYSSGNMRRRVKFPRAPRRFNFTPDSQKSSLSHTSQAIKMRCAPNQIISKGRRRKSNEIWAAELKPGALKKWVFRCRDCCANFLQIQCGWIRQSLLRGIFKLKKIAQYVMQYLNLLPALKDFPRDSSSSAIN